MRTELLSLRQWGMVAVRSCGQPRGPVDKDNVAPDEVAAMEAWDLRAISAFTEISFRVARGLSK